MSWKAFGILAALLGLFAFLPMLGIVIAGTVAQVAGCRLDGSGIHPCLIAGTDYGKSLYGLSLLGWLTIYTLPVALVAFAGLAVTQIGLKLSRRSTK